MDILVSDTSVIVDLGRGLLLPHAFRLPIRFAVPDLLYKNELHDREGPELVKLGLLIEELDGDGTALAFQYRNANRGLSLPDTLAFVLAKTKGYVLLTGDGDLRR